MSFNPKRTLEEQQQEKMSGSFLQRKLHEFNQAHNRLKHTVHTAWRYPLPPWGRAVMGFVYFSIPVVWAYTYVTPKIAIAEENMKKRQANVGDGGGQVERFQGFGNKIMVQDKSGSSHVEKIGAGGWGGGVRLANSDERTHEINKINLERFMKKQRRLKKKREREAQKKESTI